MFSNYSRYKFSRASSGMRESTQILKGRRCRARLYWTADVGSAMSSGGDASLSLAGLGVLTSGAGSED